jgi:hypothetical protein
MNTAPDYPLSLRERVRVRVKILQGLTPLTPALSQREREYLFRLKQGSYYPPVSDFT